MRFLKVGDASKELGISIQTLRKWVDNDRIPHKRTPGGCRLIDVDAYLEGKTKLDHRKDDTRRKIFYCRVSSKKQEDDLKRQVEFAKKEYPEHEVISDIGSGINWKRRGFQSLLGFVLRGEIKEVVIFHRDRLSRFGFELIEGIFIQSGTELKVHDSSKKYRSSEEELADDLMDIITIFSCRQMGKRRYSFKNISIEIDKDQDESHPEEDIKDMA